MAKEIDAGRLMELVEWAAKSFRLTEEDAAGLKTKVAAGIKEHGATCEHVDREIRMEAYDLMGYVLVRWVQGMPNRSDMALLSIGACALDFINGDWIVPDRSEWAYLDMVDGPDNGLRGQYRGQIVDLNGVVAEEVVLSVGSREAFARFLENWAKDIAGPLGFRGVYVPFSPNNMKKVIFIMPDGKVVNLPKECFPLSLLP